MVPSDLSSARQVHGRRATQAAFVAHENHTMAVSSFRVKLHDILSVDTLTKLGKEVIKEELEKIKQENHRSAVADAFKGDRAPSKAVPGEEAKPRTAKQKLKEILLEALRSGALHHLARQDPKFKSVAQPVHKKKLELRLPRFEINIRQWIDELMAKQPPDYGQRFNQRLANPSGDPGPSKPAARQRYLMSIMESLRIESAAGGIIDDYPVPDSTRRSIETHDILTLFTDHSIITHHCR